MTIQSDCHVHTVFSTDSETPMAQMVEQAIQCGLTGLCFTDHMDYGFPPELGSFLFDVDAYLQEIQALRIRYEGRITLYQGVEMGLQKGQTDACQALAAHYPFDFIIASTHLVDGKDPYYADFWEGQNEKKLILHYYECTLQNILSDVDFDVYGHLDYIIRYAPSVKERIKKKEPIPERLANPLTDYSDILDEILIQLINRGKGIECNTAGFAYGLGHPNPHESLLKRYRMLGGEILSIGSDAHTPSRLACGFSSLPALLKKAGFSSYTTFVERKPFFHPL